MTDSRQRLIVALDVPTIDKAEQLVDKLGACVEFYKIGHQLAFAGGLEFAQQLLSQGKKVFLDMKLLDIDNTVAKGVENIAKLGVDMLTIHAYPKAMKAAVEAAKGTNLCLLGVTVLTSMDDQDLKDTGYGYGASELVTKRAEQAKLAGMGGIVCSAMEASSMSKLLGSDMAIVTPGIRPENADQGDQKRVATPYSAILSGATHLVVGRPIIAAQDPKQVAEHIIDDITRADAAS